VVMWCGGKSWKEKERNGGHVYGGEKWVKEKKKIKRDREKKKKQKGEEKNSFIVY
jgi:hypothetical protein